MDRMSLDELGAHRSVTYPQRMMIVGGFIMIKTLVCRWLANYQNLCTVLGIMPRQSQKGVAHAPKFNLKIIASIVYYLSVEYLELLLQVKGYSEDLIWTCGLRNILFRHTEL
jgi:uncharacterized membrane protein YqhA